jgi:Uma2 family endonuclease
MGVDEKVATIEDYLEFAQRPENVACRYELTGGVIEEMSPSSYQNSMIAAQIVRLLGNFVVDNNLGAVTGADGGYILSPHDVVVPDAAFIGKDRQPQAGAKLVEGAPDLAVEVISPSETSRMVLDKARRYLQAGCPIVWAVYPEDQVVDVIRLAENEEMRIHTIGADGSLDGGDVLPGFSLPLSQLFKAAE